MSRPLRFLNVPYGAWHAREVPAPDPLTRTDPGTPCGEYLRRFWQPVAFARDLGDVPRRVRLHLFADKASQRIARRFRGI